MKEIFAYDIIYDCPMNLVPVSGKELANYLIQKDDLLFARQSLTLEGAGKCSIVKETDNKTVFESHLIRLRINPHLAPPFFIYYYFKSSNGKAKIRMLVQQVAAAGIRGSELIKLGKTVPSLSTQQKISSILSSFDNKIELNRRINANLEQQAQALFKSCLIDFEPFKDGKFVKSELGMIPEGWKVGKLEELLEIKYGKDHKKLDDGDITVYDSGGIMRYVDRSLYDEESVLIPRKGTLNDIMYVNHPFWSVDTMFYTIMKYKDTARFVYLFLSPMDMAAMNSGSAVPSMTTNISNNIQLIIPITKIFEMSEKLVCPMFNKVDQLNDESSRLATLRDSLLPKLMSGEIDVNAIPQ